LKTISISLFSWIFPDVELLDRNLQNAENRS